MSDGGAYEGEMARFLRLSEQEIEDLLAGNAPDEGLEDVAAFLVDVKASAGGDIDETTAQRHIAALSEEARSAGRDRSVATPDVIAVGPRGLRAVMNRTLSVMARTAAAVMAASVSMIGLAYAGVDLPGQAAQNALEAVTGLELPNQDSAGDRSVDDDVRSVIDSDSEPGCEFGQEVASAATKNADDEAGPDEDPCAEAEGEGEPKGSKATGDANSAEGRTEAEKRSGGVSGNGADNADDGKSTADERSGGVSGNGADNADDGKSTADERSGGASDPGTDGADNADNADDGKSTADDRSGGASDPGTDGADNADNADNGKSTADDRSRDSSGSSEDRPGVPVDLGR